MTPSSSRSLCLTARTALVSLGAAVALHAGEAAAQTGSGTVAFTFTSFSGPFAVALEADKFNEPNWILTGLVNESVPTPTGWATQGVPGFLERGYVLGTQPFAPFPPAAPTTSVVLRYTALAPGDAAENIISFAPRPFTNVALGQDFVLGTLTFQNGAWTGGGDTPAFNIPSNLDFRITTTSPDGPAFNQTITGTVKLVVNQVDPNLFPYTDPANQNAEADWVYIDSPAVVGSMGSFRVYDRGNAAPPGFTNIGSVDVIARFNSLDLVGLANPRGGFVSGSVVPLPTVPAVAAPEPGTWALLATGLATLGGWSRRRARA